MASSESFFAPMRTNSLVQEQSKFLKVFSDAGGQVHIVKNPDMVECAKAIIRQLVPQSLLSCETIRLGNESDGGYVMADPGYGGIAYSIGVSPSSPWDLAMAQRNFAVYQYDASIAQEPDKHPNIFFHQYFLAPTPQPGCKTLHEILDDHGHEQEHNIILQMDIEGAEWEILETLSPKDLSRFKQIIIEFHNLGFSASKAKLLEKLRQTHSPIHLHYNNNVHHVHYIPALGFLYSDELIEVSYVRNADYRLSVCDTYFPTELDRANTRRYPLDIPIGSFTKLRSKLAL